MATQFLSWLMNKLMSGRAQNNKLRSYSAIFTASFKTTAARIAVLAVASDPRENASNQVVKKIQQSITKQHRTLTPSGTERNNYGLSFKQALPAHIVLGELKKAVDDVNRGLYEQALARETGPTLIIAVLYDRTLSIAHLGNNRAYLLTGEKLHQLTVDHTRAQELIDQNRLKRDQLRNDPTRFAVRRWLGRQSEAEIDTRLSEPTDSQIGRRRFTDQVTLHRGESVLLCSSALVEALDDEEIEKAVRWWHTPQSVARRLTRQARNRVSEREAIHVVVLAQQPRLLQWLSSFIAIVMLPFQLIITLLKHPIILCILFMLFVLLLGFGYRFWQHRNDPAMFVQFDWDKTFEQEKSALQTCIETPQPHQLGNYEVEVNYPACLSNYLITGDFLKIEGQATSTVVTATITPTITIAATPPPNTPSPVATEQPTRSRSTLAQVAQSTVMLPAQSTRELATTRSIASAPSRPALVQTLTTRLPAASTLVTATVAVTSTPTVTPTPTPSVTLMITLKWPESGSEQKGRTRFDWTANLPPPNGQGYQIIFWKENQKAQNGFGISRLITESSFAEDIPLDVLDLEQKNPLEQGTYLWGVCLVEATTGTITAQCSEESRHLTYKRP